MVEEIYYNNVCCCSCSLQEGVGWISALEFIWGIVNAIISISYLVISSEADKRVGDAKPLKSADQKDKDWSKYGKDHHIGLVALIILHCIEFIIAMLIMIGSTKRISKLLYSWITAIACVCVAEVIFTIVDPFSLTFVMVGINPLRLYFAFIVWSLATEIKQYPEGAPVTRVIPEYRQPYAGDTIIRQPVYTSPAVYSSPMIVPAYGMGYGMGYGYPYGYGGYGYGADVALTGLAIGAGAGLAMGAMGGGFGGGYGGGYYDDNFF